MNNGAGKWITVLLIATATWGCTSPRSIVRDENKTVPSAYTDSLDSFNLGEMNWRVYFNDTDLIALIDTALKNNQELNMALQEIEVSRNEIRARKGEYLPFLGLLGQAGVAKEGRYTRHGAVDENLEIAPGTRFPTPLPDYGVRAFATWEVDIWKKLRSAKKASVHRYMASVEGKNLIVTNLIAEIASSYYELLALDNMLSIVDKGVEIQTSALQIVKQQKEAARVTQLAVNRFEAQLLNTSNLRYAIRQGIVESENRIHFLIGGFPGPIQRNPTIFNTISLDSIGAGIPAQLLSNRPDIRQAEQALLAAKLDVRVARANFYPSLRLQAGIGFQAFNPAYLVNPQSLLYDLAGDLMAPLINRNGIKANYNSAKARQLQAVFQYEQTILNAYVEVVNQLARLDNFTNSYSVKANEVEILMQSVVIANNLFRSARADYLEVLLTQKEALESKMDLVEIKLKQMNAKVNIYRALGGGWS